MKIVLLLILLMGLVSIAKRPCAKLLNALILKDSARKTSPAIKLNRYGTPGRFSRHVFIGLPKGYNN